MSAEHIVLGLMGIFAALGALDRIFGNRLGLGKDFEEGILAMGSLAMAMLGKSVANRGQYFQGEEFTKPQRKWRIHRQA